MTPIEITVLLVEDNKADAKFVQRRLAAAERIHCEVEHSEWLMSSLVLLKNQVFDVVLLDISLPDSHGIDTVIAVRREAPLTPIIVLSGQEDVVVAMRSMEAGADNFIVKRPDMHTEELEREILYAIERSRRASTSKKLIQKSVEQLTIDTRPGSTPPPTVSALASAHVTKIEDTISKLMLFLAKNSPSIAEQAEQLLSNNGYYIAAQDLRTLLRMNDPKTRSKKRLLSDSALTAYREASDPAPVTPANIDPEKELLAVMGTLDMGGDDDE